MEAILVFVIAISVLWSGQSEAASRRAVRPCERVLIVKPSGPKSEKLFARVYAENPKDFDVAATGDYLMHLPTGLNVTYADGEFSLALGHRPLREIVASQLRDYPKEDFHEDYDGQSTYLILEEQFSKYGLGIEANRKNGGTIILHSPWLSFTLAVADVRGLSPKDEAAPFAKAIEFKTDLAEVPDFVLGVILPEDLNPKTNGAGFRIGRKNSNASIRKMAEGNFGLNGMRFKDIERNMRPGEVIPKDVEDLRKSNRGEAVFRDRSDDGFISESEKLVDVMIAQNDLVVKELGTTHQDLMKPIYRIVSALRNGFIGSGQVILYGGIEYKVSALGAGMGHVYSPFGDRTRTRTTITITRVSNGKSLSFSSLIPEMAYRYGFYESPSRQHALDPRAVARLMPFAK